MKLKLLLGMFAFLLAVTLLLGTNQSAFAATSQAQSVHTVQIGHRDSQGHLLLNPGVQLPKASLAAPLGAHQVGCYAAHYLKLYTDASSNNIKCFGGSGYGSVTVNLVDQLYTGDQTATIYWYNDNSRSTLYSTYLPTTHRNYYPINITNGRDEVFVYVVGITLY